MWLQNKRKMNPEYLLINSESHLLVILIVLRESSERDLQFTRVLYLRIVSRGIDAKADTSFTWGHWRTSKLVKEVRDDSGDTSLS